MTGSVTQSGGGWTDTRFTRLLGVRYPVIQGPMGGGLSTPALVAAVSNAGGLGSLGAYHLGAGHIREAVGAIRQLTDRPFGVNLWVPRETGAVAALSPGQLRAARAAVGTLRVELGLPEEVRLETVERPSFDLQVEALMETAPSLASFTFGVPPKVVVEALRQRGIRTLGTATTVDEALAIEEAGVDLVCASGFEAGGHRGSFLRPVEESLVGTLSLVPQVVSAVRVPVIAAGGIADGRGILAALALGAHAAQLGTAFLVSEESGAGPSHRTALSDPVASRNTTLTRAASGRHARMIRNRFTDAMGQEDSAVLPYPLQGALVRELQHAAAAAGRTDLQALYGGQSTPLVRRQGATELMETLVREAQAALDGLA